MGKVFEALKKSDQGGVSGASLDVPVSGTTESVEDAMPSVTSSSPAGDRAEIVRKRQAAQDFGDWDEILTVASSVNTAVIENFRSLRTRILHPDEGAPPKTILVTSATPGEGKSFVCANLGISFAQGIDHYSLLVDADLRRPMLARLFGRPNASGLVNYLRDKQDLSGLIATTGVNKLTLLPAGPPPVNPAELLGSEYMSAFVNELAERYEDRLVIFDSPPLHAATETAILANLVDAVVLVVRWGNSRREHVKALVDRIGKEKIVGIVFNAYKSTMIDSKVFGDYAYHSEYSYEEK